MTMRDKIDGVLIYPDEDGFHLDLSGFNTEYRFTLDEKAAEELHAAVATEISHWLVEKRMAEQHSPAEYYPATFVDPNVGGNPYPPNDPKSPDYHDTMSEVWDSRAGK